MPTTQEQRLKVKEMLVKQLRLKVEPGAISDTAPLFREGLGLDSIDALELVSGVEQVFGVVVESEEQGRAVLRNVETLTAFIVEKGGLK